MLSPLWRPYAIFRNVRPPSVQRQPWHFQSHLSRNNFDVNTTTSHGRGCWWLMCLRRDLSVMSSYSRVFPGPSWKKFVSWLYEKATVEEVKRSIPGAFDLYCIANHVFLSPKRYICLPHYLLFAWVHSDHYLILLCIKSSKDDKRSVFQV